MQEPRGAERFRALAVDLAEPMTPERSPPTSAASTQRYGKLIPELGIDR